MSYSGKFLAEHILLPAFYIKPCRCRSLSVSSPCSSVPQPFFRPGSSAVSAMHKTISGMAAGAAFDRNAPASFRAVPVCPRPSGKRRESARRGRPNGQRFLARQEQMALPPLPLPGETLNTALLLPLRKVGTTVSGVIACSRNAQQYPLPFPPYEHSCLSFPQYGAQRPFSPQKAPLRSPAAYQAMRQPSWHVPGCRSRHGAPFRRIPESRLPASMQKHVIRVRDIRRRYRIPPDGNQDHP